MKAGFTIVELIIVVAVIGLLATITAVAYNGVQQRAENTASLDELNQLQKTIQTDVLRDTKQYIATKAPIAYTTEEGTTKLAKPLQAAQEVTIYGVFDSLNNSAASNWSSIVSLSPHGTNNALRLRTQASTNSNAAGFYATSAITNQDIARGGILDNTARHIGWISANTTSIASGFDRLGDQTRALSAHTGWNFDSVTLSANGSYSTVAAIIFNEYHDATTRNLMVGWLNEQYDVGL